MFTFQLGHFEKSNKNNNQSGHPLDQLGHNGVSLELEVASAGFIMVARFYVNKQQCVKSAICAEKLRHMTEAVFTW